MWVSRFLCPPNLGGISPSLCLPSYFSLLSQSKTRACYYHDKNADLPLLISSPIVGLPCSNDDGHGWKKIGGGGEEPAQLCIQESPGRDGKLMTGSSGRLSWGTEGPSRGWWSGLEDSLCNSCRPPPPPPFRTLPIRLTAVLNGLVSLLLRLSRREAAESCQAAVTTIMADKRQWVMVFCLLSFLSSVARSSSAPRLATSTADGTFKEASCCRERTRSYAWSVLKIRGAHFEEIRYRQPINGRLGEYRRRKELVDP